MRTYGCGAAGTQGTRGWGDAGMQWGHTNTGTWECRYVGMKGLRGYGDVGMHGWGNVGTYRDVRMLPQIPRFPPLNRHT